MINYCDTDITDWIQAIGSIIATLAAIWAFVKLFIRDNDKKKQIDSLVKIAEQSENNALQLSYQLGELVKHNEIFEKQVDLLSKMVLLNQQNTEIGQQKDFLAEQRKILSIKPNFVNSTTLKNPDKIDMNLQNDGGEAIFKEIRQLEKHSLVLTNDIKSGRKFKKTDQLPLFFKPMPGLKIPDCYCHIMLLYTDIENNEYYQIIEGANNMIKINPPVKVEN